MDRSTALRFATLVLCLTGAATATAGDRPIDYTTAHLSRRLQAVRATSAIELDGQLTEAAWKQAPVASDFTQSEPHEGEPATEKTEVRVVYDDQNLYVGVFAHDDDASHLIVSDLKKDFDPRQTDVFEVILDTFHDERNGYMFGVNPMGARWDAQMVNEGRDVNSNWDGIWSVRTRIVSDGWYAEIQIPFRTLRFPPGSPQTWGANFLRRIRRRNEDSFWAPIPRIYRITRVSMAGTIEDLRNVRPGSDFRVKPYVLTSGNQASGAATDSNLQGGFDVKYGLGGGLTWDFTVNTDFSQVEADEQQVNLTRFSLFFPEKRDFFLENAGVFQFGAGDPRGPQRAVGGGGRQNALGDNILFFSRRIGLSSDGNAIPILAGTRLTGHAGAYTVGALNIQQRADQGLPATNFSAVALRRNVLANSDVGVLILNKEAGSLGYNRLVGADANFRFFDNLNLNAYAARSLSTAANVPVAGSESTGQLGYKYRGDVLDTWGAFTTIGNRFNDELGFIPRVGINKFNDQSGLHFRPKKTSGWLREIFPHWQIVNITRPGYGLDSRYYDYHVPFTFQNSTFVEMGVNSNIERLWEPFEINSRRGIVIPAGLYKYDESFVVFNTDQGAALAINGRYASGAFYDGYKHTYQAGARVRWSSRLNTELQLSRNAINLREGVFTTDLITTRVNASFTTNMFLNALIQYNTDAQQFTSNVRFNIIFRPLSDIFIVYNDRRDSRTGALIDRALVAKMTYLMAF